MKDKNLDDREALSKSTNSKYDYDLYHEELKIVQKIIRVKRVGTDTVKLNIFENKELQCSLSESAFSEESKKKLKTLDGINILIDLYKSGFREEKDFVKEVERKVNKL